MLAVAQHNKAHFQLNQGYSRPILIIIYWQGLREGSSGGTSYLGPDLGGPGRVQVSALSFGIAP